MNGKFIWLKNPDYKKSYYTTFCEREGYNFAIVEFKKSFSFENEIESLSLKVFADVKYDLYINGDIVGSGPACPGGDWALKTPMPKQYYDCYTFNKVGNKLEIYVRVRLLPVDMCDVSCGKGGLWAEGEITFENGEKSKLFTDESWLCRRDNKFVDIQSVDFMAEEENWENAEITESVWDLAPSPLLPLEEKKLCPAIKENKALFDKIYAGYICLETKGKGEIRLDIGEREDKRYAHYSIKGEGKIRMPKLESVGEIDITTSGDAKLTDIYIMASHYPVQSEGSFRCSDGKLNEIYELGKHTVDICRQQIELDSPMHKENLGCPGDYMIESLIAYYAFGEYGLSGFDITRIANYLRKTNGEMFHTSYSLMWIYMVYDYVMHSGDLSKIKETEDVIELLLTKFDSYCKNGIIDSSPNYMFIDWVQVDGYTLHHPPKALGQTAMTAFYYRALKVAAKIFELIGQPEKSEKYQARAEIVKTSFDSTFYDEEKGLYISGLGTSGESNNWLPENPDKVYYTRHANILAVYSGLCEGEKAKQVMEKVILSDDMPPVQPYFMHFEFEALYKCGLFEKYGLSEMHKWDKIVSECNKGMKEGWGDGCGEYNYDFSHGWGATPTYQLPSKISGLKILKPGFEEISLDHNLFGLEKAEIKIPTPRGMIEIKLGEKTEISVPDGIKVKDA